MKISNPEQRLQSSWGYIDRQHNRIIEQALRGCDTILGVGSGYGSLLDDLTQKDYTATGIDIEPEAVDVAKRLFPNVQIQQTTLEELATTTSHQFDGIVFRDSFHHILGEHDVDSAFSAVRELLNDNGRVVIFDPNPTLIVRLARKLIGHQDPEAPVETALAVLNKHAFTLLAISYFEVIGLPLSGGYVGYRLLPNIPTINATVAGTNWVLSRFFNAIGLGHFICWRYLIVASKDY